MTIKNIQNSKFTTERNKGGHSASKIAIIFWIKAKPAKLRWALSTERRSTERRSSICD